MDKLDLTESLEIRRKRLRFQSQHRGTKELDLILGGFAEGQLETMTGAQLDRFEALLQRPDPLIYAWLSGQVSVPAEYDHDVMAELRRYSLVEGNRQPLRIIAFKNDL